MAATTSLEQQIVDGKAKLDGDPSVLAKLGAAMVDFELGFEILPGTASPGSDEKANPFKAGKIPASGGE